MGYMSCVSKAREASTWEVHHWVVGVNGLLSVYQADFESAGTLLHRSAAAAGRVPNKEGAAACKLQEDSELAKVYRLQMFTAGGLGSKKITTINKTIEQ